jgi:hypothetical protein
METKVKKQKVFKPRLVNAKQMSIKHPDSFSYWEEDIANLKIGNIVKVCDDCERFWVIVKAINGDNIVGEVNNGLIGNFDTGKLPPYNFGDLIALKRENIYQVWDDSINPQK